MKRCHNLQCVAFEWREAMSASGWKTADESPRAMAVPHYVLGFLVHETDEEIVFSNAVGRQRSTDSFSDPMVIPKAHIIGRIKRFKASDVLGRRLPFEE